MKCGVFVAKGKGEETRREEGRKEGRNGWTCYGYGESGLEIDV